MPAAVLPQAPRHIAPPPTKENLDFADLAIIDLAKFGTPEGKAQLVQDVRNAMSTVGFFYVINHGYTQEQNRRIFDIAEVPFAVSDEEKQKYVGKMKETGSYQGYKLRQYWHIGAGVRDQIEHYNIHNDVTAKEHPEALRPFLPELDAFARHNHFNVLLPLMRLLALGLELPEETFAEKHSFGSDLSETWIRLMKYYPRSSEDEEKTKNVWLKGHTGMDTYFTCRCYFINEDFIDFDSMTLLWSQPISALQILDPQGKWKWVKHIDNALIVNAGDALEFLSGGFYKGTIHRVRQPPADQRDLARLGVFYFALFNDDVKLVPLQESPVLQRVGIIRRTEDDRAPTMGTYRKGRIAAYGQTILKEGKKKGVEEEEVAGVVVHHYN
ncbi:hypothetical protein C0995_016327 [Termitomyces sp. Mi166|nr:hypothetical protein C0995_016327 [Termitomyces sp. Mi166\